MQQVIISAMSRTGSTVTGNIIGDLYNLGVFPSYVYAFYKPLLKVLSEDIDVEFYPSGGIDRIESNGVVISFHALDKKDMTIKRYIPYSIKNDLLDFLINRKKVILKVHEPPQHIVQNPFFSSYKKFFVIRNIFDVIHSHMKWLNNSAESYKIMKIYNNQDILAFHRYMKINFFLDLIITWKRFASEYIEYQNEFFLIKYEDLIANPFGTLKKFDEEISQQSIQKVVNTYLNKELMAGRIKTHKYFRHYNPGRKIGDFNRFFTDEMIEMVYALTKDEMEALGYDMSELVDKSIEKYEKIGEIEEVYKGITDSFKIIKNSSSVAIVGSAKAATIAYEDLSKHFDVVCFIDDFKKGEFFSLPIVSREEFSKKYANRVDFVAKGPCQKGFDVDEIGGKRLVDSLIVAYMFE